MSLELDENKIRALGITTPFLVEVLTEQAIIARKRSEPDTTEKYSSVKAKTSSTATSNVSARPSSSTSSSSAAATAPVRQHFPLVVGGRPGVPLTVPLSSNIGEDATVAKRSRPSSSSTDDESVGEKEAGRIVHRLMEMSEASSVERETILAECTALQTLCHHHNQLNCVKAGKVGGVEALIHILRRRGSRDVEIAAAGLGALYELVAFSPDHVDRFAESNDGCEVTVNLLTKLGESDARIALRACATLCLVTSVHGPEYKKKIGQDCAGCLAVIKVLQKYAQTDVPVAKTACWLVSDLAQFDGNHSTFVSSPIYGLLVAVLSQFALSDAGVASSVLSAFYYLSQDETMRSRMIHDSAGCKLIVDVLNQFGDTNETVASYGCLLLQVLSTNNPTIKSQFGMFGACEAVMKSLSALGESNHDVAQSGCGAIRSLAKHHKENKARFVNDLNAVAVVQRCLDNDEKKDCLRLLQMFEGRLSSSSAAAPSASAAAAVESGNGDE